MNRNDQIRVLAERDLEAAMELVWRVFEEFEAPDYCQEGIKTFRDFIARSSIMEQFQDGTMQFWGCFDNEKIIGLIATRGQNHISLLFVDKDYHRQGVATALFHTLLEHCRNESAHEITVNSSPYAVNVYHKLGFTDTDMEKTADGIRFTPMSFKIGDH